MGEWTSLVREGLAALNRGDADAALRNCRTDVELKRIDGSPEERDLVRGRAAVAEFLAPQAFERQSVEPLAIFEGERVAVAHTMFRARGAASGLEMEIETWIVYLIDEDGLVRRIENWTRREDAARASGLDLPADGAGDDRGAVTGGDSPA